MLLGLGGCLVPSSSDFNFGGSRAPKPPELVGDAAPAMGTEGLSGFVVGNWAVQVGEFDPELMKQMGLGSLLTEDEVEGLAFEDIYSFSADGTFTMKRWDQDWKVTGKWSAAADTISLTYEKYNDKTLAQLGEEKRKQAEVGSQAGVLGDLMYDNLMKKLQARANLYLGRDKKTLTFFKPGQGGMPADPMAMAMLEELKRIKPPK